MDEDTKIELVKLIDEMSEDSLTEAMLELSMKSLDLLHESFITEQAITHQHLVELLGPNYPEYEKLKGQLEMLSDQYGEKREQLRSSVIGPAVCQLQRSFKTKYFHVEYTLGSERVDREGLRTWAKAHGFEKEIESFINRANPYVKFVQLK